MGKLFRCAYEDTPGGLYVRRIRDRIFHFIKWDDMDDACGSDNEGQPRYCAELEEIDIDLVTDQQMAECMMSCSQGALIDAEENHFDNDGLMLARKERRAAIDLKDHLRRCAEAKEKGLPPPEKKETVETDEQRTWRKQREFEECNVWGAVLAMRRGEKVFVDGGMEPWEFTDEAFVENASRYGLGAPLWNECSNNLKKLLSAAKQESRELEEDIGLHEERMNRPVNKLGSTAREYGQGDFQSALARGIKAGAPESRIIGKMHGLSDESMDKFQKDGAVDMAGVAFRVDHRQMRKENIDDPLAHAAGFINAVVGRGKPETSEMEGGDLAEAYLKGYRTGVACKAGDQPWPEWIR